MTHKVSGIAVESPQINAQRVLKKISKGVMSSEVNKLYEFDRFRLDGATRSLWREDELIPLSPKSLELLFLLVERQGGIVSKQEIFDKIWAGTFVEDGVLTQNIYTLRQVLGTDENGSQFIENIARRGYRFAAPVRILSADKVTYEVVNQSNAFFVSDPPENLFAESSETNLKSSKLKSSETNLSSSAFADPDNDSETFPEPRTLLASPSLPAKIRRRSVFGYAAAGLGVLILAALGFGIYQYAVRRDEKVESKFAPIEQRRFQRLTDSGDVVFPTISPNGEMLAFVRLEDQGGSLWVKQIATDGSAKILPSSPKSYRSLAFSNDGRYIFFREEADGSAIYQTTILGGSAKKIAVNVWSDFGISPDGTHLVFIRRDTERNRHLLILSNIEGGGERELSAKESPTDFRSTPAWSPDGGKIIVASGIQSQFFPKLLTIDVADGKETEVKIPRWRAIPRVVWLPDGKNLIISAREAKEAYSQLWMMSYPEGEVRRLTNDLEAYFWISVSADGRMVVTRQQKIFSHLWVLPDGDLNKAKQLTFGGRNLDGYAGLDWSPDGKIVFSVFSNNVTDLYSINADGSNRIQLTANAGQDNNFPTVSHDGRFVVFTSNRTGTTQIWRMDIDGRNQKQLTLSEEPNERVQSPALSADGTEVFFIKRGTGPAAIWKIPVEGGNAVQISHFTNATPEGFVSISPDGKRLAYHQVSNKPETGGEDRLFRIGVLPTDGSGESQLFDLPMRRPFVQWTSDTAFDFAAGTYNASSLLRQTLAGGEPQKIADFPDRVFNFAWSHDGKNLVVARGKQQGDAILITNLP
jgi:Tol biopolymer transport system component/DNA-binding winged helix-turn-helix (wHTH) protein